MLNYFKENFVKQLNQKITNNRMLNLFSKISFRSIKLEDIIKGFADWTFDKEKNVYIFYIVFPAQEFIGSQVLKEVRKAFQQINSQIVVEEEKE